jgi:hypothetical protein
LAFFYVDDGTIMQRKILLIAPDIPSLPRLRTDAEVSTIQRNHETRLLSGVVRSEDVTAAITEDDYQIIWLVSHGIEDGVHLTEEILGVDALIQYAKSESIEMVVFNTCESENLALRVSGEAAVNVICTIATVDNVDAVRQGSLLAVKLTEDIDYREAYDAVSSGSSLYRFYGIHSTRSAYHNTASSIGVSISLEDDVKELKAAVFGHYGVGGLIQETAKIKDNLAELLKFKPLLISIEAMQKSNTSIPVYVFYGVLLLVALSIAALFIIIALGRGGV